jgi:hypothetical protein
MKHRDDLTPEELAALEEYELAEDDPAETPEDAEQKALRRRFHALPEMAALRQLVDETHDGLATGPDRRVTLEIPEAFIRMVEFIEARDAENMQRAPVPAEQVLHNHLNNTLQGLLHALAVEPQGFSYYRNLWNRFCDAEGIPEKKIPDPLSPATDEGGEEGPF